MNYSRVGLHLRLYTTLSAVARTAKALRLPFFQLFLHREKNQHRLFFFSTEDERNFLSMRPLFKAIYVHGSYFVNMAISKKEINTQTSSILEQELKLAKRLQATHYVMHPGSIEKGSARVDGLIRMTRFLNEVMKKHEELIFCIENTSNPLRLLGGLLEDFLYIQERIEIPERFGFCLDTAHAHAAGYALDTNESLLIFLELLMKYKFPISLIHLNDTYEQSGSRVDLHAKLGSGLIGMERLHAFVNNELINNIPLLVESPELSFDQMKQLLNIIREW